jgi:hypothetical protein
MMAERAHALSSILGKRLVSTNHIPERRKSQDELRRMAPEDRLIYEREHPWTDAERMAELEREDRDAHYDMTGEVDERDLLDNHPPPDWGT